LNTEQTCAQVASVVGGVRPYLVNRAWLIHRLPANVDPIGRAASFPLLVVSPAGPIGAIFDFQSGPSAFSIGGTAAGPARGQGPGRDQRDDGREQTAALPSAR
jgi:hypothetical protein